ncbi:inactive hydroxysteroid dehydrogenase-like protein 1 [Corythoichthys intestinalis]|uniref:inactive hydroxysteroid dehydrogenase-like protein 1 n=1 Tax=Corythoichthys intestinalis TaxID=161448 RepID=UPI0025A53448|nr:inactive hydroxysteroid dehydrogenase-like protein 1 [Corythoichthys intestinalis]XP_061806143.1 inactive hydroxysteroid dehydrogenase-like protein 1 [Nerophis lumbriciformis]
MAAVDSFHLLYREISRSCSFYVETLAVVGALYTASKAVILLKDCCEMVRLHFLPRIIPSRKLRQRYGDWAVVYGASEPVAQAYAEELARQGLSIIFVTKHRSAISDFAANLTQSYGVETILVHVDSNWDEAAGKPVRDALRGKDVGFLVNCVDEACSASRELLETSEQRLMEVMADNVAGVTLLTRLVLPGMLERGRGAVVNISSSACCRPMPGKVTLTAATGYLDHFSRALHLEYGAKGVFVQSLLPFQIASSNHLPASSTEGWFAPTPQVYAHHAISTLGVSNRTTGYWPHTLQYGLMKCIPEWIWILGCRVFIS